MVQAFCKNKHNLAGTILVNWEPIKCVIGGWVAKDIQVCNGEFIQGCHNFHNAQCVGNFFNNNFSPPI